MRRKRLIRPTVLTLRRPDKTRQRRIRQDRINSAYSPLPRHLSQKVASTHPANLSAYLSRHPAQPGCRMRRKRLIRPTVLPLRRPDKTRQRRIRQDRINSAYSPLPRHLSQKVASTHPANLSAYLSRHPAQPGCRMRRKRLIRPTVLPLRRPDKTRQRRIRQDRINSAYSPLPRHLSQKVASTHPANLSAYLSRHPAQPEYG